MEKVIVNLVGIKNISMLQMINTALASCLPPKEQGKSSVKTFFPDIELACAPGGHKHSAVLSF